MQMLQSDWLRFWGNVYMSMNDKIPEKTKTKSFKVSRLQTLKTLREGLPSRRQLQISVHAIWIKCKIS